MALALTVDPREAIRIGSDVYLAITAEIGDDGRPRAKVAIQAPRQIPIDRVPRSHAFLRATATVPGRA